MSLRRLAGLATLCGMVVLLVWVSAGRIGVGSPDVRNTKVRTEQPRVTPGIAASERIDAPQGTALGKGSASATDVLVVLPDVRPFPRSEIPPVHVTSAHTADPDQYYSRETDGFLADECLGAETCIDQYLWSVYQRAPKVDTIKVSEQIKITVKKRCKTQTVTQTVTKLVDDDFTWKDPKAAQKAGMSLMDYLIGGMDRTFKLKLYHALRAMDDAGLSPGMTSGFRDDYRQSLASGNKAANDSSYHGGSRRGGYGHGLAADLVSVKGDTRAQRCMSSERLWKWIDAHGQEFGIGRPYLDKDPPHVGPIDGREYVEKRSRPILEGVAMETNRPHRTAVREHHGHIKTAQANPSREAPAGHRQQSDPDKKTKELDGALAKKLRGICRHC